jgi:aspartate aminotransferase
MNQHDNHNHEVHLNLNVRGLAPSATVAINDRSNELLRQGHDIVKLGLGQSPFPVPEPVVESLRRNAP